MYSVRTTVHSISARRACRKKMNFFHFLLFLTSSILIHFPIFAQNHTCATPSTTASQQETHFEKLSVEHGLSQSTVKCILQDQIGYIWFGTMNGLNKYDGYSFIDYRHNPNDPNSISSDRIMAIAEDRDGDLWIGTVDGLNKLDRDRQKFVSYKNDPANPNSLSHNMVNTIFQDKSGTLWIGTALGLNRFEKETERFTRYGLSPNDPMSLSHNSISTIFEDSKGNLWIGTFGGGLIKFYPNRKAARYYFGIEHDTILAYTPEVIAEVSKLIIERPALCSIVGVADSQRIAREFQVSRQIEVLILSEGEGTDQMYDYGWLEQGGKPIWQTSLNQTRHAGGAPKNRIQISVATLAPSLYTLHYQSDDSHSCAQWNQLPPSNPEIWGIQIIPLSRDEAGFFKKRLQDYIKFNALSSNNISAIREDRDGAIWIGTQGGGLNKLESGNTGGFIATLDSQRKSSVSTGAMEKLVVYQTTESQYRRIYTSAVFRIVDSAIDNRRQIAAILGVGDFQHLEKTFKISKNTRVLIVAEGEGIPQKGMLDYGLILRDDEVIWQMDPQQTFHAGGAVKNRIQIGLKTLPPGTYVVRFKSDDRHSFTEWNGLSPLRPELWGIQILAITEQEEKQIHSALNEFEVSNAIAGNHVRALHLDDSGALWIATNNGLSKFDKPTGQFTNFSHIPTIPTSLSTNDILSICEDSSGVIWIGTVLGGANKFSRNKNSFQKYTANPFVKNSLRNNIIYAFCEDQMGFIWIGTRAGLNLFDRTSNEFYGLDDPTSIFHQIGHSPVMTVHEDPAGQIWVATMGQGIFRFAPKLAGSVPVKIANFTHYSWQRDNPRSLGSNNIWKIFEESDGVLWIGTDGGGLNKLDAKTEDFVRYVHRGDDSSSLSQDTVLEIYEDCERALWIGTNDGLNRFDKTTEKFQQFKNDPGDGNSLSHNAVTSIYEQDSRYLWVATYGGGLNKFDKVRKVFTRFTEKDGLPNNVIYSVVPDDLGNLWLSTNKGLSRFDPVAEKFKNYDMENGLQNNEFNTGAYLKARDSSLFFGGIDGFNIIYPERIKTNLHLPAIVITRFKKFDQEINFHKAISEIDQINLDHQDNFISFEFAALDYTNPRKNQYAYKLEGFDRAWIYCGNQRFATYTNLDPGDYTFRVKGSNNDGLWNEHGASLHIYIAPPFWQTWWFCSAAFCAISFALFTGHKYRVKQKIKQTLELERVRFVEREKVRGQVSKDYHDELGHKLTKISLFSELIKRKLNGDSNEVRGYLDRVIKAAESLSGETRDFIWTLNPGKDNVYELALYLKEFGEALFEETNVNFQVANLSKELELAKLPMEWKRHLSFIFKEGMNNILRHSSCKQVRLEFALANNHLQIQLEDDGVGLAQNGRAKKNGSGNGLNNMRFRAEEIAGQISIESKAGKGTSIHFSGKIPGNGYFV